MKPTVAVLYQAKPAPAVAGVSKPMKPGGYRDSGADIAFALTERGVRVVTRREYPRPAEDLDWVFPDSWEGIRAALAAGADTLWLNTVLYEGHPATRAGPRVVGQPGPLVERYDDKLFTNGVLRAEGLPVADSRAYEAGMRVSFPCVIKPIRGRGSFGVRVLHDDADLARYLSEGPESSLFIEPFLPGEEITLTVMPAGNFTDGVRARPWCLPTVRRFHHLEGVAPYSGEVAIVENSAAVSAEERRGGAFAAAEAAAVRAAELLGIRAPIRIDARADESGKHLLFDLNLKPNLTGPGRPGRSGQDSLVSLSARAHGWSYGELVENLLDLAWVPGERG